MITKDIILNLREQYKPIFPLIAQISKLEEELQENKREYKQKSISILKEYIEENVSNNFIYSIDQNYNFIVKPSIHENSILKVQILRDPQFIKFKFDSPLLNTSNKTLLNQYLQISLIIQFILDNENYILSKIEELKEDSLLKHLDIFSKLENLKKEYNTGFNKILESFREYIKNKLFSPPKFYKPNGLLLITQKGINSENGDLFEIIIPAGNQIELIEHTPTKTILSITQPKYNDEYQLKKGKEFYEGCSSKPNVTISKPFTGESVLHTIPNLDDFITEHLLPELNPILDSDKFDLRDKRIIED